MTLTLELIAFCSVIYLALIKYRKDQKAKRVNRKQNNKKSNEVSQNK